MLFVVVCGVGDPMAKMHLWGGGCLCIERKGGVGNRFLIFG